MNPSARIYRYKRNIVICDVVIMGYDYIHAHITCRACRILVANRSNPRRPLSEIHLISDLFNLEYFALVSLTSFVLLFNHQSTRH